MKKLETRHQLLEEERELERKVKRTALENDDARSQSTGARDNSHFNWTPKKRDFQQDRQPSNTRAINSSFRSNP